MTVVGRGARSRRGGRRPGWALLTALLVFAIGASSALVFTDRAELLKLAVILALWAAIIAAFASVLYRRQSDLDRARARDMKMVYDLQLDREISARREYELELESHLRRELASELRAEAASEVVSLRAELAALRTNLEILFDADLSHKPALETDRRATRAVADWERDQPRPDSGRLATPRVAQAVPAAAPDPQLPIIDVAEEPAAPAEPAAAHRQAGQPHFAEPVRPARPRFAEPAQPARPAAPQWQPERPRFAEPVPPEPPRFVEPASPAPAAPRFVEPVPAAPPEPPRFAGPVPPQPPRSTEPAPSAPRFAEPVPAAPPERRRRHAKEPAEHEAVEREPVSPGEPESAGRHGVRLNSDQAWRPVPADGQWLPPGTPGSSWVSDNGAAGGAHADAAPRRGRHTRGAEPPAPPEEPPADTGQHGPGRGQSVADLLARLQPSQGASTGGRRRRRDE